jgi:hypothetical protein
MVVEVRQRVPCKEHRRQGPRLGRQAWNTLHVQSRALEIHTLTIAKPLIGTGSISNIAIFALRVDIDSISSATMSRPDYR